jgi:hypothetical protein
MGERLPIHKHKQNMTQAKDDTSVFRFLNSILNGRDPIMTDEDEKDYVPFLTNRGLSQNTDTIMFANEMNMMTHLTKTQQYDYLFRSVRKFKRPYKKWPKAAVDPAQLELVQKHYNYSTKRARDVLLRFPELGLKLKELYSEG